MLWIFNREKRQARELIKLANKTIARMEQLLAAGASKADRELIESHLKKRRERLSEYERFFADQCDKLELQLMHPLRHADTFRKAMLNELQRFSNTPTDLAKYIRLIRAP